MHINIALLGRTIPSFNLITERISRIFNAEISRVFLDFPLTRSYRSDRGQYDADVFLNELSFIYSRSEHSLFITHEDIFSSDLDFIFGLASGPVAIVSLARLDPRFYGPVKDNEAARSLFIERIIKECVHELGHTTGIQHCKDAACVMHFSNSIDEVDAKSERFCNNCKKKIGATNPKH